MRFWHARSAYPQGAAFLALFEVNMSFLVSTVVRRSRFTAIALSCLAISVSGIRPVVAQQGGGGQQGGGTIGSGAFSGVAVDADGVLRSLEVSQDTAQLMHLRAEQASARLGANVARPSQLRKVSLTRLIAQLDKSINGEYGPDEVMKSLAGLTRIQYVFYYPATKDVVIAGPAEGWVETPGGRVIGIETGRPVLELQDLAVALRTFAPGAKSQPLVYCSIDPTQEGLARENEFLRSIGRQIVPGDEQFIVDGLRESLGLQVVTVGGVPANTHFAQVLVEADYRMKLIGIGLEEPPVNIASYVALANPATIAANAMARWWFVPDYKRIKATDDGLAAEFVGPGVKLVGEDEVVDAAGNRQGTGGGQSAASRRFTRGFTDKYNQLAERSPVYGQLRNCIDMLVAAAFIQQHDLFGKAGATLGSLGDEAKYPVQTVNAPKQVETAVNAIWKGNRLATPIGGGVEIRPVTALDAGNVAEDDGEVAKAYNEIDLKSLPADQWWWD